MGVSEPVAELQSVAEQAVDPDVERPDANVRRRCRTAKALHPRSRIATYGVTDDEPSEFPTHSRSPCIEYEIEGAERRQRRCSRREAHPGITRQRERDQPMMLMAEHSVAYERHATPSDCSMTVALRSVVASRGPGGVAL